MKLIIIIGIIKFLDFFIVDFDYDKAAFIIVSGLLPELTQTHIGEELT